jgi:formylglycine-generating enzyme required for sulfatase activity
MSAAAGVVVGAWLAAAPETSAQSAPSCPSGMVIVAAGTFTMGELAGPTHESEQPLTQVTLGAYCLDRTEVTASAYAACVRARACTAPRGTLRATYGVESKSQHPVNFVDWRQSSAYCRWSGGRLPTEAEWEYAARGREGRRYPWGAEPPTAVRAQWSGGCGLLGCVGTTAPVGTRAMGRSWVGADDLAGNVWEWVADWHGRYPGGVVTDPRGARTGTARVLRGGSWVNDDALWMRSAFRFWGRPTLRSSDVGFRCARQPL